MSKRAPEGQFVTVGEKAKHMIVGTLSWNLTPQEDGSSSSHSQRFTPKRFLETLKALKETERVEADVILAAGRTVRAFEEEAKDWGKKVKRAIGTAIIYEWQDVWYQHDELPLESVDLLGSWNGKPAYRVPVDTLGANSSSWWLNRENGEEVLLRPRQYLATREDTKKEPWLCRELAGAVSAGFGVVDFVREESERRAGRALLLICGENNALAYNDISAPSVLLEAENAPGSDVATYLSEPWLLLNPIHGAYGINGLKKVATTQGHEPVLGQLTALDGPYADGRTLPPYGAVLCNNFDLKQKIGPSGSYASACFGRWVGASKEEEECRAAPTKRFTNTSTKSISGWDKIAAGDDWLYCEYKVPLAG